jgi:hypothetical protein
METNTKQTPKSCSCNACRLGKHTEGGHFMRRYDNKAYRHDCNCRLKALGEDLDSEIFNSGPIGNYYD